MKLIIQPDDGLKPVLDAVEGAKKSVEIAIFRWDQPKLEEALVEAVARGVAVRALIAFTNRGGENRLRGLEMRLLAAGATVARTNNDLARYHAKYFIVDAKKLFVLGFNFSKEDLRLTRSFGIVTTDVKLVKEAGRLFEADCTRQEYTAGSKRLLVSPSNARERLAEFLAGAKKELLIYDLEVGDPAMLKILSKLMEEGVDVRVIGKASTNAKGPETRASHPLRLHARTIVRDQKSVFVGSQSLRRLELDQRREMGILVDDEGIAGRIAGIFQEDWESAKTESVPADKLARKVAKAITRELGDVRPVLEEIAARNGGSLEGKHADLEADVKEAVRAAVREVVHEAVTQPATTK